MLAAFLLGRVGIREMMPLSEVLECVSGWNKDSLLFQRRNVILHLVDNISILGEFTSEISNCSKEI